ncbi:MAG: hypothetical protein KJ749_03365 [Planctomycetes bacterium]|nr:hypothetical protein [Planctomycetota bacterium]
MAKKLETSHPSAAGSLREGLAEPFTVNRWALPGALWRCLRTTSVIQSPYSAIRRRTSREDCRHHHRHPEFAAGWNHR